MVRTAIILETGSEKITTNGIIVINKAGNADAHGRLGRRIKIFVALNNAEKS
jgi:hypothetical protein